MKAGAKLHSLFCHTFKRNLTAYRRQALQYDRGYKGGNGMQYLVNSQEMKQYDKNTIEYYHIPSAVLMERAALAVFEEIRMRFSNPKLTDPILVVCGAGNNGGDGLAIARLLHLDGYQAEFLFPMKKENMTPETKAQYQTAEKYCIPEITDIPEKSYAVIIDALFGIGLSRNIEGKIKDVICKINQKKAYKVAVDIASGISADSGQVLGAAFSADLTVTFGFAKTGQLLYPGAAHTGELIVADIGIDKNSIFNQKPFGHYLDAASAGSMLPARNAYSNKGSYGKVLIIAGSPKMAGAAYFAAKAAYYSGCGLVRILTPKENRDILLTRLPEAIITTYDAVTEDILELVCVLEECMKWAEAVLIGPGLGISSNAKMLVAKVLQYADKKIVFDADALNILAKNLSLLKESKADKIITPHLGEMSRLSGNSISEIQQTLVKTAVDFAEEYKTVCVLKDARTIVGAPKGEFFVNTTGNHGMATGGSGDVLAGLLTGIFAQSNSSTEAAALSCYLHGMAGDFAAQKKGACSMLASDLLEMLPAAIQTISDGGVKQQ